VFEQAQPIVGGREFVQAGGRLEEGARPDSQNNFQGRYAIRHRWTGPIRCEHPQRGVWGGPWPEIAQNATTAPTPALDPAFAPRGGLELATAVTRDVPEIGLKAGAPAVEAKVPAPGTPSAAKKKAGCGCQAAAGGDLAALALALGFVVRRRRQ